MSLFELLVLSVANYTLLARAVSLFPQGALLSHCWKGKLALLEISLFYFPKASSEMFYCIETFESSFLILAQSFSSEKKLQFGFLM